MVKKLFNTCLTVIVFALLYAYTAFCVFIVFAASFLKTQSTLYCFMQLWAKGIFIIMGRKIKLSGFEKVDKNKKYILLINHSSLFDIPAVLSFFPKLSWFGREYLLKIPLFGKVLRITNYTAMKKVSLKNTKTMLEELSSKSKNHTIAIFPEGTRTLDGKLGKFFRGFIPILRSSGLDVVPITLNGFFSLKPKSRFYIDFFSKQEAIIHPVVENTDLVKLDDQQIINKIKEIIASVLKA